MDLMENYLNNVTEPEWLEKPVLGSIRAWQVMFLALGGVATIIVVLCCCIRFRVPRTKQQIEADYQRRKITNKFRQQLEKIQDAKMDTMSLKDALSLLHAECSSTMMEKENGADSQRSSILSPQHNSMESPYPQDGQKPEPQVSGNFVKFAAKVASLNKFQTKSTAPAPTSPSPSKSTKMDF